jgi:hypothetical protein
MIFSHPIGTEYLGTGEKSLNKSCIWHMFIRWNAMGHKFAQLASGGSVYVLLMVAGLDLCFNISRALGRVPFEVGKMLRRPDNSSAGHILQ